jgi:hypothetical protein
MSEHDQMLMFKNLIFQMAMRVATLEKILLDKNIISLDELADSEESLTQEANQVLNEKRNNSDMRESK